MKGKCDKMNGSSKDFIEGFEDTYMFLSADNALSSSTVLTAINYLQNLKKDYLATFRSLAPSEEAGLYIDDTANTDNSLESLVQVTMCGIRLNPSLSSKTMQAIVPASFCTGPNVAAPSSSSTLPSTTFVTTGDSSFKRKNQFLSDTVAKKKGNQKVNIGALEDMQVSNLYDFWNWIERNQYFSQPMKENSLSDLQFLDGMCGDQAKLNISVKTENIVTEDDDEDEQEKQEQEEAEEEKNDMLATERMSFYYQRLLSSIVVGYAEETALCFQAEYSKSSAECSLGQNDLKKLKKCSSKSYQKKKNTLFDRIDLNWMTLQQKTTATLGVSGILSQDMITYENGIDVSEEIAETEGEFDRIHGCLRSMIAEVSELELDINRRLAALRTAMGYGTVGPFKCKVEAELRKAREHEKSLLAKWHKYQKKYSILTEATTMIIKVEEKNNFVELPW